MALASGSMDESFDHNRFEDLPVELFELILGNIYRDDAKAMRLVNKTFEGKISPYFFRSVVVPFNSELQDMVKRDIQARNGESGKGKGKRPAIDDDHILAEESSLPWMQQRAADDDTYRGHGYKVFSGFGRHIRNFGMSFEVTEEDLRRPPTKQLLDSHESFYGSYEWPPPSYRRFDKLASLERTADEMSHLRDAMEHLRNVKALGLSLNNGLGWLSGDESVNGIERPRIFGNVFSIPSAEDASTHALPPVSSIFQAGAPRDARSHLAAQALTIVRDRIREITDILPWNARTTRRRGQNSHTANAAPGIEEYLAGMDGMPNGRPDGPRLFGGGPAGPSRPTTTTGLLPTPAVPGGSTTPARSYQYARPANPVPTVDGAAGSTFAAAAGSTAPARTYQYTGPAVPAPTVDGPADSTVATATADHPDRAPDTHNANNNVLSQQNGPAGNIRAVPRGRTRVPTRALGGGRRQNVNPLLMDPQMHGPMPGLAQQALPFAGPVVPRRRPGQDGYQRPGNNLPPLHWAQIAAGIGQTAMTNRRGRANSDPDDSDPDDMDGQVANASINSRASETTKETLLNPAQLSQTQKEWLLEADWAMRAFLQSYMLSIVDNKKIFQNVTFFNFALLSSRFLPVLSRTDFWSSFPSLERITLHIAPDWRSVERADHDIMDKAVQPSEACDALFWLLHNFVGKVTTLKELDIGWTANGKSTPGRLLNSSSIIPAPVVPLEEIYSTNQQLLVELPNVEQLTFTNCYFTPHTLKNFVRHIQTDRLERLSLKDVSLTADRNPRLLQMMNQPTRNANGLLPDNGPKIRATSWTALLNDIAPVKMIQDMESMDRDGQPHLLDRIDFIDCGYVVSTASSEHDFDANNAGNQQNGQAGNVQIRRHLLESLLPAAIRSERGSSRMRSDDPHLAYLAHDSRSKENERLSVDFGMTLEDEYDSGSDSDDPGDIIDINGWALGPLHRFSGSLTRD
ncbi:Hypothetical protein D9617_16g015710 [Elsinoe fawcettii]|nr:Hypothetical protein D9617_16g015710 [Elsinoe fawcettii]